jgi:hypothetical protein
MSSPISSRVFSRCMSSLSPMSNADDENRDEAAAGDGKPPLK